MTKHDKDTPPPEVRGAQGAAREAIGKLIGDDAAIRAGRDERRAADKAAGTHGKKKKKE